MTIKVSYDSLFMKCAPPSSPINVMVKSCNMFDEAQKVFHSGKKIALHNFANNECPGLFRTTSKGTHYFMTNTQEEQLLRASLINGKIFLPLSLYPIGDRSALFTHDVLFTNDCKNGNYLPEKFHYKADVITCAAIKYPKVNAQGNYLPEEEELTLQKMLLVLYLAKDVDVFFTGLWGAGAFGHKWQEVMRLWKKALDCCPEGPKEIVFCHYIDSFTNIQNTNELTISSMSSFFKKN